jgi:hypothetical protein
MMHSRRYYLFFLSILFVTAACSSKKFEEPGHVDADSFKTKLTFRLDYENTWRIARGIVGKYPVLVEDRKLGIMETDWIQGKSDQLYSGFGKTRIPYKIRYKFFLKVEPEDELETKVKIETKEEYLSDVISSGDDLSGSIYKWYPTESSGHKASVLLLEIEEEIKKNVRF